MILTISGKHGSGKSVIGKKIALALNIKYYSTGQAFRDLSKEMKMPQIDRSLKRLKEKYRRPSLGRTNSKKR